MKGILPKGLEGKTIIAVLYYQVSGKPRQNDPDNQKALNGFCYMEREGTLKLHILDKAISLFISSRTVDFDAQTQALIEVRETIANWEY